MKNILDRLEILKANPSTTEKVNLLEGFLKDKWFEKTIQYALNPNKHFNMKGLPTVKEYSGEESKEKIFNCLDNLSKTLGASNDDKIELAKLCQSKEAREVVTRIIKKKLRCGASAKLVNKAKPGTILVTPYQRCSTKSKIKNIKYPAYAQEKMDGLFCNCVIDDGKSTFLSRTGNEFVFTTRTLKNVIERTLGSYFNNQVFMGEFLVYEDKTMTSVCDRKTGNGILNKALKGTISKSESNRVFFVVWDMVSLDDYKEEKGSCGYGQRFYWLSEALNPKKNINYKINRRKRFKLIKTKGVKCEQEAYQMSSEIIENGGEGIVLKDFTAVWKNGTSTKMIKVKSEKVCELQIIGWQYGDKGGKYEKCLGAFKCASLNRELVVDISGGLTDDFRGIKYFDKKGNAVPDKGIKKNFNACIGNIVSVVFAEVITNKKDDSLSLFLPRFDTSEGSFFRVDKKIPDTAKYIQDL